MPLWPTLSQHAKLDGSRGSKFLSINVLVLGTAKSAEQTKPPQTDEVGPSQLLKVEAVKWVVEPVKELTCRGGRRAGDVPSITSNRAWAQPATRIREKSIGKMEASWEEVEMARAWARTLRK